MKEKDRAYENKVLAVDSKEEAEALIDYLMKKDKKSLLSMSRDERSLLLYLESCAVEYGGKVQSVRMNPIDFDIIKEWEELGFIHFGRIAFNDIETRTLFPHTHWVILSEEAWKLAHEERKEKCNRLMEKLNVERIGFKK